MKVNIENLKDTFEYSYRIFEDSIKLAAETIDAYHNRQYSSAQLNVLKHRKQPAETFNIIKLFSRSLDGYFDSAIHSIRCEPITPEDTSGAVDITDSIKYILRNNSMKPKASRLSRDAFLTGLQVVQIVPYDTKSKDQYGRAISDVKLTRINPLEVIIDPLSREDDYSDARFIHRFKWVDKEQMIALFGTRKVNMLVEYENTLNIDEAEFTYAYKEQFNGLYKMHDNYLVVHTEMVDTNGKVQSVYWTGDYILSKEESKYPGNKFSYKVNRVHKSDIPEFYGIFKDVLESQKAINQALIKIQLLVNTERVLMQPDALPEGYTFKQFQKVYERIGTLIPVENLNGIRIEDMSRDVASQYIIIDKALERIKQILHITDSFLGMAFASDSGRKVNIQKTQTIIALSYIASPLAFMYEMIGWDLIKVIQTSYNFTYFLKREINGQAEWKEMNKPIMMPRQAPNGQIYREPVVNEVKYDEASDTVYLEYLVDPDVDLRFSKINLEVTTESFNESDEADRLMLEQTIQGPVGQSLLNVAPALFMQAASLSVKSNKTRNSEKISDLLLQAAQMLGGAPTMDPRLVAMQGNQRGMPGTEGGETPASQMMATAGLSNSLQR